MGTRVADFVTTFREEMRDKVQPYFWSNDLLVSYIREAQLKIAEKTLCLVGQFTLEVEPGTGIVIMDEAIIRPRRAWIESQRGEVEINCVEDQLPAFGVQDAWNCHGSNRTLTVQFDQQGDVELALYRPKPNTALQLTIAAYRRPVCGLTINDKLEINSRYDRAVLFYMKYLGLLVQDAEVFDKSESNEQLRLFGMELGDIKESQAISHRSFQPIRYNEY